MNTANCNFDEYWKQPLVNFESCKYRRNEHDFPCGYPIRKGCFIHFRCRDGSVVGECVSDELMGRVTIKIKNVSFINSAYVKRNDVVSVPRECIGLVQYDYQLNGCLNVN